MSSVLTQIILGHSAKREVLTRYRETTMRIIEFLLLGCLAALLFVAWRISRIEPGRATGLGVYVIIFCRHLFPRG